MRALPGGFPVHPDAHYCTLYLIEGTWFSQKAVAFLLFTGLSTCH